MFFTAVLTGAEARYATEPANASRQRHRPDCAGRSPWPADYRRSGVSRGKGVDEGGGFFNVGRVLLFVAIGVAGVEEFFKNAHGEYLPGFARRGVPRPCVCIIQRENAFEQYAQFCGIAPGR